MKKILVRVMVLAACLCPVKQVVRAADRPNIPEVPGWRLVWQEEFEGNALDAGTWSRCRRGSADWKNTMSDDPRLLEVKDGVLHLKGIVNDDTAQDPSPYLTAGVTSQGKYTFGPGKVQIRARFKCAQGAWPALWMLGAEKGWPGGGEIDLMEHLNFDDIVYQTVHSEYTERVARTNTPKNGGTAGIQRDDWNTYGCEWDEDRIVFTVNGEPTLEYPRVSDRGEAQWPFDQPFYFILSMQIGGKWVNGTGPTNPADYPAGMEIDWVRVYRRENPMTTVHKMDLSAAAVPPTGAITMTYHWEAPAPTSEPYTVFVHIKDSHQAHILQADHMPPVGTTTPGWQGAIQYDQRLVIPAHIPDGAYPIILGLYNKSGRLPMKAGPGVEAMGEDSFQVGTLVVDRTAPFPKSDTDKPPTLDLSAFELTFSEAFDGPLDVSSWGPGTRWIAHTPWAGDFGDARFEDPTPEFPFQIQDGVLRIEARKKPIATGRELSKRELWASGLLASNDPHGSGFSQQYGYFEMRAKLPPGPGVWPAFWLASSYDRKDPSAGNAGSVEIDVLEYYGRTPSSYTATVHVWKPDPHQGTSATITTGDHAPSSGFHTYGCMVDENTITMYFDGAEVWKTATPAAHNKPLMVLLNLALGPGWPIDETPSPSFMDVDYVRVYTRKSGANGAGR